MGLGVHLEAGLGPAGSGDCSPGGRRPERNANVWIQLFHYALKAKGRAGFIMANSDSDARASEQEIRRKLIESRAANDKVTRKKTL